MELEVKRTLHIDLDEIIEIYDLTPASDDSDIRAAVYDEVCGWDDANYYLVGDAEEKAICEAIAEKLRSEPTAKDWEDFWREN